MGMMDEKRYLTGTSGVVKEGDVFHLHGAEIAGTVNTQNGPKPEAKLMVSKNGTEEPIPVFTTGAAIVGQVQRVDNADRQRMAGNGWRVKLGTIPNSDPTRSPAFILEDAAHQVVQDSVPGQTPEQGSGF